MISVQSFPLPPVNRFGAGQMMPYSGAMGAMGLPGDWSSASRFIRAAFVRCNTPTLPTYTENVNQFFRVLQSVAMPMGSIQLKPGLHDITRYSCCCTGSGENYFTTYRSPQLRRISLMEAGVEGTELKCFPKEL